MPLHGPLYPPDPHSLLLSRARITLMMFLAAWRCCTDSRCVHSIRLRALGKHLLAAPALARWRRCGGRVQCSLLDAQLPTPLLLLDPRLHTPAAAPRAAAAWTGRPRRCAPAAPSRRSSKQRASRSAIQCVQPIEAACAKGERWARRPRAAPPPLAAAPDQRPAPSAQRPAAEHSALTPPAL